MYITFQSKFCYFFFTNYFSKENPIKLVIFPLVGKEIRKKIYNNLGYNLLKPEITFFLKNMVRKPEHYNHSSIKSTLKK